MITASRIAPISRPLNSSASGNGPMKKLRITSTGITNSAICALEPIAMATARSTLSRAAKYTVGTDSAHTKATKASDGGA